MTSKNSPSDYAISVQDLQKSFNGQQVLLGVNFKVRRGTILALLGPNGAGKTTTIRILSTLLKADGGRATINGLDISKQAAKVRANIGLTGQFAAVDEYLTGEENLKMVGHFYHLPKAVVATRCQVLLEQLELVKSAKKPVKTYSGGMKRKLDLAMSLIASPPVIFLDEPTTGLDPRSRLAMWAMIRKLADNGTTILLTTQYMDEADHLADNIVVLDNGKIIAEGDADSLKAKVGSDHLDLLIAKNSSFKKAQQAVDSEKLQVSTENRTLSIATQGGVGKLKQILQRLEAAGVEVENVSLRRPTLDDVFLSLTGHVTQTKQVADEQTAEQGNKNE